MGTLGLGRQDKLAGYFFKHFSNLNYLRISRCSDDAVVSAKQMVPCEQVEKEVCDWIWERIEGDHELLTAVTLRLT
jgi:hypothetical protein